jgi:putative ABC transport system permease protein
MADSSYFQTMRIPILAGRGPSGEDRAGGPAVAVIDEVIARTWWKSPREAIGQHIKLCGPYMQGPVVEIVGVAGNVPQEGLDNPPDPQIYLPATQRADGAMVVMIRTRGTPESIAPTVRATLASIDSDVPIQSLKPLDDWLGATLVARRGAMGLLIGLIGCWIASRWVSNLVFGITVHDPFVLTRRSQPLPC